MKRFDSIDVMRGIVMLIMVLDHTRDLLHLNSITQQPTDLNTTTIALFFTRWITHLCAPTFVFLSGVSAYISYKKTNDVDESRKYLLKRGLWLILLDLTVINFGVWFDIHFDVILFNVLSAIGIGFILLALLLKLQIRAIGVFGLAIIFLHNLVPIIPFDKTSLLKKVISPFFATGAFPLSNETTFVIGYPPIPWLGIMLLGFMAGLIFQYDIVIRKKLFLRIGILSLMLFMIIRIINKYGDLFPWVKQKTEIYTFLSFLNVSKYPPSLQFCLLTLGVMFLILFTVEGIKNKFTNIASVYGKVPLFFFVIHWYIVHPVMFLIVFLQGYKVSDLEFGFNFGRPKGASGVELWSIYLIWIVLLMMLYPICKWYGDYKERHKENRWLRYM